MLVLRSMHGNDLHKAHFPADRHAAATAMAAARHFGERCGVPPDAASRLAIVVEELVVNIVEHGEAGGTPISLALALRGDEIALILCDGGRFFDPRRAERPDGVPVRGGGAGLALVRTWCRIVDYRAMNGRNRLALTMPLRSYV